MTNAVMSARAACGDWLLNQTKRCDETLMIPTPVPTTALSQNVATTLLDGLAVGEPGYEACDDGNETHTDGCLNTCQIASCGDSVVRAGVEECDDGDDIDNNSCSNLCVLAECGDGVVQLNEDCDDGDQIAENSCTNTCKQAACGDGIVRTDVLEGDPLFEECDDGNSINGDGCDVNCRRTRCGNGIITDIEQCDDGKLIRPDNNCKPSDVETALSQEMKSAMTATESTVMMDNNCTITACGNKVVADSNNAMMETF